MKKIVLLILLVIPAFIFAQTAKPKLKIIPDFALKAGSQDPKFGIEGDLITGVIFKEIYFIGLGGGYASNMGLGGAVYPLFIDGRINFSAKNFLNHFGLNVQKEAMMQVSEQTGITVNTNDPYKTGFLMRLSLSDNLINIPSFSLDVDFPYCISISLNCFLQFNMQCLKNTF